MSSLGVEEEGAMIWVVVVVTGSETATTAEPSSALRFFFFSVCLCEKNDGEEMYVV